MRWDLLNSKASVIGTAIAALGLALSFWEHLVPDKPEPIHPQTISSVGDGSVFIQGNGNSVVQHASEAEALPRNSRRLIGTWFGTTEQANGPDRLVTSGYMRLSDGGAYDFSGDLRIEHGSKALTFAALASGTWRQTGEKLVLILSDVKTTATTFSSERGETQTFPVDRRPKLEELLPKGSTQEYQIVELTDTHLVALGADIRGTPLRYEATRQQ